MTGAKLDSPLPRKELTRSERWKTPGSCSSAFSLSGWACAARRCAGASWCAVTAPRKGGRCQSGIPQRSQGCGVGGVGQ